MKKASFKYDLTAYNGHLTHAGLSPATAAIYETRIRAILQALGLESASEDYLSRPGIVSKSALREVLGQYSASSRIQALCAWRSFVEFLCVDLPRLESTPRARGTPRSPSGIHPQAVAIWALFRPHPSLDPMLIAALKWKHLRWRGTPEPSKAFGVEILDEGTPFVYMPPLTAFQALWDWARGRYDVANPDQPLVTLDCEGWEPIPAEALAEIHRAGRAGRIPRLLADAPATTGARPTPPVPPTFGGGKSKKA